MNNPYIISAIATIFVVHITYIVNFYFFSGYGISNDSAVWGQFGDYIGGILNPLLSFVSIMLLIKSLNLQREANASLIQDINNKDKTEKLRSFESIFFNMLNSQKEIFEALKIELVQNETLQTYTGVKSVIEIEALIEDARENSVSVDYIRGFLGELDENDCIFGVFRAFYVTVFIIDEKLSDAEGFSSKDRKAHFLTLINFTNFSQLRLILICAQFMDWENITYIRKCTELKEAMEETGLKFDQY
jgi:uncharacterized protein YqgC (DUF456 family)